MAVAATPPPDAVNVASVGVNTVDVVIANVVDEYPSGTVTGTWGVAAALFEDTRTRNPPASAGAVIVTVPVTVAPP